MVWKIDLTPKALDDLKKIKQTKHKSKTQKLLEIISINPFANPPPYEKLSGLSFSTYSRRINIKHRLVYEVYKEDKIIRILRMWTHYE